MRTVLLLILVPLLSAPIVANAESYEVTASGLNVRKRPTTRSKIVGVAKKGEKLFGDPKGSSKWVRVSYKGATRYVFGKYLKAVDSPTGVTGGPGGSRRTNDQQTVTASGLNLRSGPGTGNSKLTTLTRGTKVNVLNQRGNWTQVSANGQTGWVYGRYLSGGGASSSNSSLASSLTGGAGGNVTPRSVPASTAGGSSRSDPMSASQSDLEILARICKGEAGIASYENKVAVLGVLLNRVRDRRWPSTIRGVAHQPKQFSCYNPDVRQRLYYGPIPQDCWRAAREALSGNDPSGGSTHYFNPYIVKPRWARNLQFVRRIGTGRSNTHDFYK